MPSQPPQIDFLWAAFKDPLTESQFRDWSYSATVRVTRTTVLMASALFFFYALYDYVELGRQPLFFYSLWLRSLGLLIGLVTVLVIMKRRERIVLDVSVVAFELSVSSLFGAILALLRPEAVFAALGEMIVVLGAFLFIPNRFSFTIVSGWLIAAGFVYVDMKALQSSTEEMGHILAVLLITAVFGTAYSHRVHVLRRREYAELMTERRSKELLEQEVERRKGLERELLKLATTDALTGASNRRHFMKSAEREITRSRRHGRPLSVLLIDIDHFKRINDSFGHAMGDRLLIELTRTCQSNLRTDDVFGRIGGEEFAVVTPEIGLDGAVAVAERLRHALQIPLPEGSMSVSIGVVELAPHEQTIGDALKRADQAMYAAKRAGRNQVKAAPVSSADSD